MYVCDKFLQVYFKLGAKKYFYFILMRRHKRQEIKIQKEVH
jgi:hypothetical protein